VCHKLSERTTSIGKVFSSAGALNPQVYIHFSVSDRFITQSLNSSLTDSSQAFENTFTSKFVFSSTAPLSDKGERTIFLNVGLLSSIFTVTSLDSQIMFSSESSVNAFSIFSHVISPSISFSNIQSELEVVVNSVLLFNSILI